MADSPAVLADGPTDEDYVGMMWQTKPDTLNGKYLRQFWYPVSRTADLQPGSAIAVKLLSEKFTLYRGETGVFHLTEFSCPHRQTQLSVGYVEGDSIRCLYHGWKFGADGLCTERPADGSTGNIKIRAYPTREYLGLVYVFIGDGAEPQFPPYPGFTSEGIVETFRQHFPCNYFQSWENDWDIFHAAWTHKTGEIHGPSAGAGRHDFYDSMLKSEQFEETDYGIVRRMRVFTGDTNASILFMPATVRLLIPTFNEMSKYSGPQFRETYLIHTPIDDFSHDVYLTQLVPVTGAAVAEYYEAYENVERLKREWPAPEEFAKDIFAGRKTLRDAASHPMLVAIEDLLAHVGQGTIADRSNEKLGRSDVGVVYLRRLMARELSAFAKFGSTKEWSFADDLPEGLRATVFAQ